MEMLQGVWNQNLRPRAVVGYGVKIFLPSPPNYVTRSPGNCTVVLSLSQIFASQDGVILVVTVTSQVVRARHG